MNQHPSAHHTLHVHFLLKLWMNLNCVNTWFSVGNPFCITQVLYIVGRWIKKWGEYYSIIRSPWPIISWPFDIFNIFENHGYITEPVLWFLIELWLWTLRTALITAGYLVLFLTITQFTGRLKPFLFLGISKNKVQHEFLSPFAIFIF